MHYLTTRFNNVTFIENMKKRKEKNLICIYGAPRELNNKIKYDEKAYVIEMNNDLNKVEGIGMIRNRHKPLHSLRCYEDRNCNRYVYVGKRYISRDELMLCNNKLLACLDDILFKGKSHMKRGSGFTTLSPKLLTKDKCCDVNVKLEIDFIFRNRLGR
jgi:hypothetical protein